jgi:hypothetical protein
MIIVNKWAPTSDHFVTVHQNLVFLIFQVNLCDPKSPRKDNNPGSHLETEDDSKHVQDRHLTHHNTRVTARKPDKYKQELV